MIATIRKAWRPLTTDRGGSACGAPERVSLVPNRARAPARAGAGRPSRVWPPLAIAGGDWAVRPPRRRSSPRPSDVGPLWPVTRIPRELGGRGQEC